LSHLRLRATAYKKASGKDVPYVFGPRREGDAAECYAETTKAAQVIILNCLFTLFFSTFCL
jgi:UDP-glucose 4-epimerase